jgi:hypothetical protein
LLGYFGGSVALGLSFGKITFISGLLLVLFNYIYSLKFNQSTALVVAVAIAFFLLVRSYKIFKYLVITGSVAFISLLIYLSPVLEHYKDPPEIVYGNNFAVMKAMPILAVDPSIAFRLIIYYRLVIEEFPSNIIGKGFGTPLFPYQPGVSTVRADGDDEYVSHVTGAHNTYITLFSRLGIGFALIFILMYRSIFREFFIYFKYYNRQRLIFIFMAFLSLSIIGLFNLVLESPIFASMYWILLGFISKAITLRIREMN